ncbi:MAG TPA: TraK family protein [Nitrosospira sp.]|nr:TraK family protein [Nitrosospira sp.]
MEKAPRKKFRGAGRVAFLARKEGIQKMIEEGYPNLVIYEKYGDELKISYSQFARYIRKFFVSKEKKPDSPAKEKKKVIEKPIVEVQKEEKKDAEKIRSKFEEDPEEGDFI